jgi:hypothetical protein
MRRTKSNSNLFDEMSHERKTGKLAVVGCRLFVDDKKVAFNCNAPREKARCNYMLRGMISICEGNLA